MPGRTLDTGQRAPFTWFGGKRRFAPRVNEALGAVARYAEPFLGSGAVLLSREEAQHEVVCDKDAFVANCWRAIRADPVEVAWHCDYPTIHQELNARRRWLSNWQAGDGPESVSFDDGYYDAKCAGYWLFCVSNWISGPESMLAVSSDNIPRMPPQPGGRGVTAARIDLRRDGRPAIAPHGGRGIQAQCPSLQWDIEDFPEFSLAPRPKLVAMLVRLARRFERVYVLSRDFESALTPAALLTHEPGVMGIVLDPPYKFDNGRMALYMGDSMSDCPSDRAWAWALAHADNPQYRIVFFCHEGDYEVPPGWTFETRSFKHGNRRGVKDMAMFSPHCFPEPDLQGMLL